jgi:hypothetical protein
VWLVMTNHLHALVQIAESPLGKLMQSIAQRYACVFHAKAATGFT